MFAGRMLARWFRHASTTRRHETQSRRALLARPRLTVRDLESRLAPALFTVTVGTGTGLGSLPDAVVQAAANPGDDTIQFGVASVTLTSQILIDDASGNLLIQGNGAGSTTINYGGATGVNARIFDINSAGGLTVTLQKMTLSGGTATGTGANGGAIRIQDEILVTDSVTFNNNKAVNGGAISVASGAQITINNSVLSANTGTTSGGAIHFGGSAALAATLNMSKTSLDGNSAGSSGGGGITAGTSVTLNGVIGDSTFTNNIASSLGGAISSAVTVTLNITNSTFTGNKGSTAGAIRMTGANANLTLTGSNVSGNTASSGGGIYVSAGSHYIGSSTISNNVTTGVGAGLRLNAATLTMNKSTISGNSSSSTTGGGGVYMTTGTLTLTSVSIADNSVTGSGGDGGGVYASSGTMTITDSSVTGNTANGNGGGLRLTTGKLYLSNSTVSNNISGATTGGGGIYLSSGTASITFSTIAFNSAPATTTTAGGGGIRRNSTSTTNPFYLQSTVVAQNTSAVGGADIHAGTTGAFPVTGSGVFLGVADAGNIDVTGVVNLISGTAASPADPLLNPVAALNGGTTLNHLPMSGSKLRNAGDNLNAPLYDQRGGDGPGGVPDFDRVLDGFIDIGSVESSDPTPLAKLTPVPPVVSPGATPNTFDVIYTDSNGNINVGSIGTTDVTVTGPGGTMLAITGASSNPPGNAGTVTVTYTFTPPGGAWDWTDNGKYTVAVKAGEVFDTDGPNSVIPGDLGSFQVGVTPPVLVVDNDADVDDGNYGAGQLTLREAISVSNLAVGTADTITFAGGMSGKTIFLGGELGITDPLTVTGLGAANLTINGGGLGRIFAINVAGAGGTVELSGLTLTGGNATTGTGGAISVADESVTLTGMVVTGNSITGTGGGIGMTGAATLTVNSSTISANQASSTGGGIHVGGANSLVTINKSTIDNNSATSSGGGIYASSTVTVDVSDSTVSNNRGNNGGGVRLTSSASTVTINRSTFSGNTATSTVGGGLYTFVGGKLTMTASTFVNNVATSSGGAMTLWNGDYEITNSTLSGNIGNGTGTLGGGAISLSSTGILTINNSTIANNTAVNGAGGGIRSTSSTSTVTLNSTILAANTSASGGADFNNTTTITLNVLGGDNLVGVADAGNFTLAGLNQSGTSATPLNPLLEPLANTGGPTETHKLMKGSPAFNKGSNVLSLSFDQRGTGFPRVNGSQADVGAFEGVTFDPAANATSPDVPPVVAPQVVTVVYTDEAGVNTAGIGLGNVRLTGTGYGSPEAPTSFTITSGSSGDKSITVEYKFNPPGGTWDWFENGKYVVEMQANQVFDIDGPNAVAPGVIGTFLVDIDLPALTVDNDADTDDGNYKAGELTLREAINLSNADTATTETIGFAASMNGKTLFPATTFNITNPVVINGPGASQLTIDGGGVVRHFTINVTGTGGDVSIAGLTLTNGKATSGSGGAISVVDESVTLSGMVLTANSITGTGGAIGMTGAATLTLGTSTISNNSASSTGGAIHVGGNSIVTVNKSTIDNNVSASTGGAIHTASTVTVDIADSTISNNRGTNGGGLRWSSTASTVTMNRSTVSGNTATTGTGGGMYFFLGGALTVNDSTFNNNVAATSGGGMTIWSGTADITNSTISGNIANGTGTTGGGGISLSSTGTLTLNNTTVTKNSAPTGAGGGIRNSSTGTVNLNSSIVADNTSASGGADLNNVSTVTLNVGGGDNLVGVADAGNFFLNGTNFTGTAGAPLDPQLDVLGNYGGPTQTHRLTGASAAINKGNNNLGLLYDQRGLGFNRVGGASADIGAYELDAEIPLGVATSPDVSTAGGTTQTITVEYTDDVGILTSTLGSANDGKPDIEVSGPGLASPVIATFTGFTGGGTKVTATYTIPAAGGTWDAFDNGLYTITMLKDAVTDGVISVPNGAIGSFKVGITGAFIVSTSVDEDDNDYSDGDLSLREAVRLANASAGNDTVSFKASLTGSTITLLTGQLDVQSAMTITGLGAAALTVSGNNASRIFNISDGDKLTSANVSIAKMTLTDGKATGDGGAINNDNENLTLSEMKLTGNFASIDGGGLNVEGNGATINIVNSTISFNTAGTTGDADGGGINFEGEAFITISGTQISDNTSFDDGGGILFFDKVTQNRSLLIENSAIVRNVSKATTGGGGGMNFGGVFSSIAIRNSTISGNSATKDGGGIQIYNTDDTFLIQNTTIAFNTATGANKGGGINQFKGSTAATTSEAQITLQSSIVSDNVAGTGADIQSTDGFVSVEKSAVGSYSVTNFTDLGGSLIGQPLFLSPATGNGGLTETVKVASNSPVVDAGYNPASLTTDQRGPGFPRLVGAAVDMGSFEVDVNIPAATIDLPAVVDGAAKYTFTVTYTDDGAIDWTTIGAGDVTVTGPGFGPVLATFEGVDVKANGPTRIGTYSIVPPGGTWDGTDNGKYTFTMNVNEVRDTGGVPASVPAGTLGVLSVAIPVSVTVDTLIDEDDGDFSAGDLSLREAIGLSNNSGSPVNEIKFAPSLFIGGPQTISLTLGVMTITNFVSIVGPGANKLTIDGNNASRIFRVDDSSTAKIEVSMAAMSLTKGQSSGAIGTQTDGGGAIFVADEFLTLDSMELFANTAASFGGAIFGNSGSKITILNSSLHHNTANGGDTTQGGGAIQVLALSGGGILTIRNSTLAFNRAGLNTTSSVGGAIIAYSGVPQVTIENSTITQNTAHQAGGVRVFSTTDVSAFLNVTSSIVSGNTGTTSQPDFQTGSTLTNISLSLVGSTTGLGGGATLDAFSTTNVGADPMLGALQNNGGPTTTMALLGGSPAINNGSNPAGLANDQRGVGFVRTSGAGTDIGAFEVQAASAAKVTSVKIDDGTAQHSLIRSLTVTFNQPVELPVNPADAFTLTRQGGGSVTLAGVVSGGGTVVTLTFSGAETEFTSLKDGRYNFSIDATKVTTAGGTLQLDGNGDGTGGDNYVLNSAVAPSAPTNVWRLFGDSDGDNDVDTSDFGAFRAVFGGTSSVFDFDNDGDVDTTDFGAFRARFGGSI